MPQWGKTDNAANSVLWGPALFNTVANSTTQTALFGNTTSGAFVAGEVVGQYGVDTTEMGVGAGAIINIVITSPGSGYFSNGTVTFAGGGGAGAAANAEANATGRIAVVNITNGGSSYETSPTVTISAPAAQAFNANTAVAANGFIAIASNKFQVGDRATYLVAAGNTALVGLANNTAYFVQAANSTGVYLSASSGGAAITLTKGLTETGHSLTGETATAAATEGGAQGVQHAGWVIRTEGTGGRAGRIQYETLVAMGSITGDASDDNQLPDA
jgi:hypothetical protein